MIRRLEDDPILKILQPGVHHSRVFRLLDENSRPQTTTCSRRRAEKASRDVRLDSSMIVAKGHNGLEVDIRDRGALNDTALQGTFEEYCGRTAEEGDAEDAH